MCYNEKLVLVRTRKTWEGALRHCRGLKAVDPSKPADAFRNHQYDLATLISEDDHVFAREKAQETDNDSVWLCSTGYIIFLLCVYIYLLNVGRCGQAYASWPVSGCGSVEKQCFTRIWADAPRTTVAPWWRTAPNLSQQETVRNEGASSVTRSLKRIIPVNLMHPKTPLLPPCSMFRFCHFYNISWLNCWAIDKSLDENKCIQT